MAHEPTTLRLLLPALARRDGLLHLLQARVGKLRPELVSAFELNDDERGFARELLRRRPAFWLFRTHQRCFAGDFVAVDMASPSSAHRRAWAIDLKLGAPLKVGGGGAGVSFARVHLAIAEIATETSALSPDATVERVTGDGGAVLRHLGA
jgi:hypothetical protein